MITAKNHKNMQHIAKIIINFILYTYFSQPVICFKYNLKKIINYMFSANSRRRRRRRRAQFVMQILILTCTANDAHLYNLHARSLANTFIYWCEKKFNYKSISISLLCTIQMCLCLKIIYFISSFSYREKKNSI